MLKWLLVFAVLLTVHIPHVAAALEKTAPGKAAIADAVFDFAALTATPLNPRVLKSTEKDGIVTEEVMFHSERDGDKDVEIFGYFSYPKGAQKLPAFVWNQAGLGQAGTYFNELGARRGYAALCIDMPMPGYRSTGSYPISMNFDPKVAPRDQPIYHGAVALLKAVSFLESRPEVDKARLGMAGSSWGGFFTTMMAGIDPRLKAASAMFGAGNLQTGSNWWDGNGNSAAHSAAMRETWRTTLDPAFRLPKSKTAVAWFTGTNDHHFWLPSVIKTYEMAGGPKHLTLLPNWNHGLTPILDDQVFVWLDQHLQSKPALLKVTPLELKKEGNAIRVQWRVSDQRKIASASLIRSPGEAGNWESRPWVSKRAQIKDGVCQVVIVGSEIPQYISGTVVDSDGYISSTPLLRIPRVPLEQGPVQPLFYDGAASWGEFEKDGVTFVNAQGLGRIVPGTDARKGEQSAQLSPGANGLTPLYYVPEELHTLGIYLKADKATTVTVELKGTFDGKPQGVKKDFAVGTTWTLVMLDFTPPKSLAGTLGAIVTVPEDAKVVADSLSFMLHRRYWEPWLP